MGLKLDAISKGIHQVRSEMRFYVEKGVPNYSAEATKEAMERLEQSIPAFGAKMRSFQTNPLERLKLLRDLGKLHQDLGEYDFGNNTEQTESLDEELRPVVSPILALTDLLNQQQTKRNFPRHDH